MKADDKEHWFIAYTLSCQERKAAEQLSRLGVRSFVAIQQVKRKWSDRVKLIDHVVLPHLIFVRTTFGERIKIISLVPQMTRYMSAGRGAYDPAVVPDSEMDAFMLMLSQSETPVKLENRHFTPGQKIKVVKGPLSGLEAELTTINSRTNAVIKMDFLGVAAAEISLEDIVPAEPESA